MSGTDLSHTSSSPSRRSTLTSPSRSTAAPESRWRREAARWEDLHRRQSLRQSKIEGDLTTKLGKLEAELVVVRREKTKVEGLLVKRDRECGELRRARDLMRANLEKVDRYKFQRASRISSTSSSRASIDSVTSTMHATDSPLPNEEEEEELADRIRALESENALLSSRIESHAAFSHAAISSRDERLAVLQRDLEHRSQELDRERGKVEEAEADLVRARAKVEDGERRCRGLEGGRVRAEAERDEALREAGQLRVEMAALRERLEDVMRERDALAGECASLIAGRDEGESQNARARAMADDVERIVAGLEMERDARVAECESLRRGMEDAERRVRALMVEVEEVRRARGVLERECGMLRGDMEEMEGRFEGEMKGMVGRAEMEEAVREVQGRYKAEVEELQEEKEADERRWGIVRAALEKEIRERDEVISRISDERRDLGAGVDELLVSTADMRTLLDDRVARCRELDAEVTRLAALLEGEVAERGAAVEEAGRVRTLLEASKERLMEAESELCEARDEAGSLRAMLEDVDVALEDAAAERDSLRSRVGALSAQRDELTEALERATAGKEAVEAEVEEVRRGREEVVLGLEDEIERLRGMLGRVKAHEREFGIQTEMAIDTRAPAHRDDEDAATLTMNTTRDGSIADLLRIEDTTSLVASEDVPIKNVSLVTSGGKGKDAEMEHGWARFEELLSRCLEELREVEAMSDEDGNKEPTETIRKLASEMADGLRRLVGRDGKNDLVGQLMAVKDDVGKHAFGLKDALARLEGWESEMERRKTER
ncbi:hypothetical protein HK101_004715 [Irineochytrium annulatum]|nr:hypothetical protein HK101_004715 [Irineochytrium annulatum]